jgi:hypothetical protein
MVCPTFSTKCTNSSGGLLIRLRDAAASQPEFAALPPGAKRRIANPPQVGNLPHMPAAAVETMVINLNLW